MDPSLAGLLGAYGSGDEEEEEDLQIYSPGVVASQGMFYLLNSCTTEGDSKHIGGYQKPSSSLCLSICFMQGVRRATMISATPEL